MIYHGLINAYYTNQSDIAGSVDASPNLIQTANSHVSFDINTAKRFRQPSVENANFGDLVQI